MTPFVIWLIAFAVILYLCLNRWDASLNKGLDSLLPAMMRSEDDRWIWCPALAVIVATAIIKPAELLLTVIVIAVLVLLGTKLAGWAMNKVDLH